MAEISIIIPVFNCEDSVAACVDSVTNQTFKDIEIILINDGSTDQSDTICRKLAEEDNRIIYYSRENFGLAATRNFGISVAGSKFICFADSDDYLEETALEFMHKKALSTTADIVLCGYYLQSRFVFKSVKTEDLILNSDNINQHLAELKDKNLIDPVWNKLYKSEFLKNSGVLMPEGEIFEDTYFNLSLLEHNPKIVVLGKCFYHYLTNIGSITRRYNREKLQILKARAQLLRMVSNGIGEYCDYYYIKSVFSAFIDMFISLDNKEILNAIADEIKIDDFKSAAQNADYNSLFAKAVIGIAKSYNSSLIFAFCKLCYFFKYKF